MVFPNVDSVDGSESDLAAASPDLDYVSRRVRRARALLRKVKRLNRQLEREMWRQMNTCPASPDIETAIKDERKVASARR